MLGILQVSLLQKLSISLVPVPNHPFILGHAWNSSGILAAKTLSLSLVPVPNGPFILRYAGNSSDVLVVKTLSLSNLSPQWSFYHRLSHQSIDCHFFKDFSDLKLPIGGMLSLMTF